jgi:hypothetical protein
MLLLALFFIVVATSLATLVMANSSQLIRVTRHEHEVILLRQLTDSGWAWVRGNKDWNAGAPVTLRADGILPDGISGDVVIRLDEKAQDILHVTARIRLSNHDISQTTLFRTPS